MKLLKLGWLIGLLAALDSCTFSPRPIPLTVKWDGSASKFAAPSSSAGMGCYFINILGPGIPPNYGSAQLGNREASCLGFGFIFGPYSSKDLQAGAKIKVLPGSPRTVQVLGAISSAYVSDCINHTLPEYFNTASPPQLYSLGQVITGIFRDSAITVEDTYVSSAKDIVPACNGPVAPTGGGSSIGPIIGVKAHVVVGNNNITTLKFDPATGSWTSPSDVSSPAAVSFAPVVSDDFSRYFVPTYNNVTSTAVGYSMGLDRVLAYLSNASAVADENWSVAKLSPSADNFYAYATQSIETYRHDGMQTFYQSSTVYGTIYNFVVTPTHVFAIGVPSVGGAARVASLRRTKVGETDYLVVEGGSPVITPPVPAKTVLFTNRNYDRLYVVGPQQISILGVADGVLNVLSTISAPINDNYTYLSLDGRRL